jgi:DNA-binding CsgD family transcriptional regulator/tetratricopeptide (TPR) repeat protein
MTGLLEREPQIEVLTTAWRQARNGPGGIALVTGEAGIGKTSLVQHFIAGLRGATRVLWGACDSLLTPRPLGPLYDMARQETPALQNRLQEGADAFAIGRLLLAEFERRPAVALFEDVHWADEATLDLLKFLGRRIGQTKSLLILTYRLDELHASHPLQIVLGDLATTGLVQRIQLRGLSVEAVRTLAAETAVDAADLHRRTSGNPFFIAEILASAGAHTPATVRDAVLARAARLSPPGRAVLDAAAAIGARVEPWLLEKVAGANFEAVDECLSVGMLRSEENVLGFWHELARQVILEATSAAKKLVLHRKILTALQASHDLESYLARLAFHAEGAGDREAVARFAPAAARQATAAHAHREAVAQYRRALRFTGGLTGPERAELLEAYGSACGTIDDQETAAQAWEEARQLWRDAGEPAKESFSLNQLAGNLVRLGRNAEAEEAIRAAIELLSALPPMRERGHVYAGYAGLRMLDRDNAEAIRWGNKAISLAEEFEDMALLVTAYNTVGSAMMVAGDRSGQLLLERSVRLAQQAALPDREAWAYGNLSSGAGEMYDFALADHYLAQGIAFCQERDIDSALHYMQAWQALTHFYQGRWTEADELARQVLGRAELAAISRIMALVALGRLQTRTGQPGAGELLDEAMALAGATGTLQRLAPVHAARAEAAWLASDKAGTLAEAKDVYDLALEKKHIWFTAELAYWRWLAGDQVSPPEWAATPYSRQLAGDWAGAAAAWEEIGCPYERARALAEGDEAAKFEALAIFERLEAKPAEEALRSRLRAAGAQGIPRGPRPATRENPFGLTARQMEVFLLLSEGMTNKEIAERLTISPRTVEQHVTAILSKLEISSRQEAIARAWELKLVDGGDAEAGST